MGEEASQIDPEQLKKMNKGPIAKIWEKVEALWEFILDPDAPIGGKAIAIAALIYLISPVDAVPDFLPGGLLDDAGVITLAVAKLADDLRKYLP